MLFFLQLLSSQSSKLFFVPIVTCLLIPCAVANESIIIEKVASPVDLGEGPHWDIKSQTLYHVDILGKKILKFDPATGTRTHALLEGDGLVSLAVPIEGEADKFVASKGRDLVVVTWNSNSNDSNPTVENLLTLDCDRSNTRINDGKCDANGRLWLGTMAIKVNNFVKSNQGCLYRVNNCNAEKILEPLSIGNGLAWNKMNDVMYYIDSLSYQIWSFDFDLASGNITNKRVVFDLKTNNIDGIPDGMTIDVDDNLWIAVFDGSCVLHVNPTNGQLLRKIMLPVKQVTSLAFGGPLLDVLYVTTARECLSEKELLEKPDSGSLYVLRGLGTFGLPAKSFKLK